MGKNIVQPIRRHQALVQFSREHHYGLLLVWKIRQGIKNGIGAARIAKYVLFFFEQNLQKHFREEETFLFVKLKDGDSIKLRAFQEHEKIYSIINFIREDMRNIQLLDQFSNVLEKHIRFEERVLFNYLQRGLSERELIQLAEKHSYEKARDTDDLWNDKYWIITPK